MTNSQHAFKMNIDLLVDNIPLRDKRSLYFWTFTAPEVLVPSEFKKRWNYFILLLKRKFPTVPWVRVFELHPSPEEDWNGHGFHIHAVTNVILSVEDVRLIANKAGFGRIHAKRIPCGKATNYLGKYLDKTKRSRARILKGVRLWQCINFGDMRVKVKNILRVTFRSYVTKNLIPLNGFLRQYIKKHNPDLEWDFGRNVGLLGGFKRIMAIGDYIDRNILELAQTLIEPYNEFRACNKLEPMYVY